MPTLHLVATSIDVSDSFPAKPSSIVGAPPQLSDGADASYAEVWTGTLPSGSGVRNNIKAHFDPVTWPPGSQVSEVLVNVRYSTMVEGGAVTRRWGFEFRDQEFTNVVFLGDTDGDAGHGLPADDSIGEGAHPADFAAYGATPTGVRDALARPFDVWVSRFADLTRPSTYRYGLRVYELSLDLVYTAPARRTPAPPAQLSGRVDGLGPLGGPPRLDTAAPSRQSGFHPGGYY